MKLRLSAVIVVLSTLLSACSLFTISKPDKRIILLVQPATKNTAPAITNSISLASTTVNPSLNTNTIVIRSNNTLSRIKGAVWSDTIGTLIHYILLSNLRSSSKFTSISDDTEGIIAEYTIQTSLVEWNIVQEGEKQYAIGAIYCNIVDKRKGIILAQQSWTVEKVLPNFAISTMSSTFQFILDSMSKDMTAWLEEEIGSVNINKKS